MSDFQKGQRVRIVDVGGFASPHEGKSGVVMMGVTSGWDRVTVRLDDYSYDVDFYPAHLEIES